MTDMERRNFEDSFKNAFDGAEVTPSENVWTNIELELEKAEGGKIRRRLMFYKMLAAASVAFAMCVAGVGYYVVKNNTLNSANGIASNQSVSENNNDIDTNADVRVKSSSESDEQRDELGQTQSGEVIDLRSRSDKKHRDSKENSPDAKAQWDNNRTARQNSSDMTLVKRDQLAAAEKNTVQFESAPGVSINEQSEAFTPNVFERNLPVFYSPKNPTLDKYILIPDAGTLLLAKLADEERRYADEDKKEKKNKSENLWTSLGFAAGGFSSVNHSVATQPSASAFLMSNSSVPEKQSRASGVAYSYGVNLGTRISDRWVIQGGVNYLTQSSDYVATNVVGDNNLQGLRAESINELEKISQLPPSLADNTASKLAPTVPYSVNNNVRFFSIPLQAGYLLVNQKFSLQLNGGVSTDLFLQNTITPEGGSLDKTTQGRGDDSPYRSVNFSGLMGTEFSYKFGQRYRVALNPGLRYPLNSVYKSDVGIQSTPLTFDIGLRFRYIFH